MVVGVGSMVEYVTCMKNAGLTEINFGIFTVKCDLQKELDRIAAELLKIVTDCHNLNLCCYSKTPRLVVVM